VGTYSFRNWNGSALSTPRVAVAPRTVDDLIQVVKDRDRYPSPLRAAGSFHSLNDCFTTTGTQLLTRHFDDIRIDLDAGTITVGAAVSMVRMRDALWPHGMQIEVTPEIGNATAGSVACCGTKDASIGRTGLAQVSSTAFGVRMVNARGEVETVSESDPERMRVIRSSYGLLGAIFEVTFRIQPSVILRYDYRSFPLTPAPSRERLLGDADGALCFAQPFANRIIAERRYVVRRGVRISRVSRMKRYTRDKLWEQGASFFPTLLPANWFFGVLDEAVAVHLLTIGKLGGFEARRSDSTVDFRFKRRHYFDFTFWAIPASRWTGFLPEYIRLCREFRRETGFRASLLSQVYLMGRDESSLLSPTRHEEALTMDLVDTRMRHPLWAEFNRRFNTVAADHGGRPLLNQTKQLSREVVHRSLGEDWDQFIEIRNAEDPDGRFLSDYFASLL
jgi:L-gulonolactone oxidase